MFCCKMLQTLRREASEEEGHELRKEVDLIPLPGTAESPGKEAATSFPDCCGWCWSSTCIFGRALARHGKFPSVLKETSASSELQPRALVPRAQMVDCGVSC